MLRCKVTFLPVGREVYVAPGTTVKDAIDLARFELDFPCGGRGRCGKCRVLLREGAGPPAAPEQEHLEAEELEQGYRLACTARITGDAVVELPYVRVPEHKILIDAVEKDVKLDPHIRKTCLELDPPTLTDHRSDWERLLQGLDRKGLPAADGAPSLALLRRLPLALRRDNFRVTAVTDRAAVHGVEEGDTAGAVLGIAFDIGTTTVVGYLMDLLTGREICVVSALNPQTRHGADVITRIAFSSLQADGLQQLHEAIIGAVNELIGEAAGRAAIAREDIYAMSVVGNTCMHHLFLGISPKNLALAPYKPVVRRPLALNAATLGIDINPAGMLYVLPNIAGFVGADTVGVLLATELDWSGSVKLAIDIGTNGEIVLGSRERLVACSTAAGPAFEGAQISSGMRGAIGAIDHVRFGAGVEYSVIGGVRPKGICGSGLLDAVAGLVSLGIVDQRGRILHPDRLTGSVGAYRDNIVNQDGGNAFLLVPASEAQEDRPVLITQQDIRQVQLAKGAIATGIQVLLEELGIALEDVSQVLLAGAFGNYLDPHSACAIGLIPSGLEDRIRGVGNAAGAGSKAALLSRGEFDRAAMITDFAEYIELSAHPGFKQHFVRSLNFVGQGDRAADRE